MNLPKADADLFYKLHPSLLTYINQRLKSADFSTVHEFMTDISLEEKCTVRNALYDNVDLIDDFCKENPFHFSIEELAIVKSWKQFVKEKFVIVQYLKQYTIFLDWNESSPKAYGVVGLYDPLDEVVLHTLPTIVDAVLLPFKNKIIYDGLLVPYLISFGSGYRRSIKEDYAEAKAKYGIITALPFTAQTANNDFDNLKFYMRTQASRQQYKEETAKLIIKDVNLALAHRQYIGKIDAQSCKRDLKKMGITQGWFSTLHGIIIASGLTKLAVEKTVEALLPKEKIKFVYFFQIKNK